MGFGFWDLVLAPGFLFAGPVCMARALWKGAIAFGLVNIPVELHTAVRDSRPRFRMLHAEDKSPVRFERVCAREGKPVARDELMKITPRNAMQNAKCKMQTLSHPDTVSV